MRYHDLKEAITSDPRYLAVQKRAREGLRAWRGVAIDYRPADPGDFGAGQYYTTRAARARTYAGRSGDTRQTVLVFNNAFVVSVDDAYDLAERYGTIHGTTEQRLRAARQMTDDMRSHGYDGFIAVHPPWGPLTHTELEIVKYD